MQTKKLSATAANQCRLCLQKILSAYHLFEFPQLCYYSQFRDDTSTTQPALPPYSVWESNTTTSINQDVCYVRGSIGCNGNPAETPSHIQKGSKKPITLGKCYLY